jgi:hypothetical protein
MSDYGWETIDHGDWTRSTVKPMDPWRPDTQLADFWQQGNDEPEEKS